MDDDAEEDFVGKDFVEEDDVVVDARGARCPVPVLRLAAAVRHASPGTTATVLATDPAVEHDVPAWARMRGHDLLGLASSDGVWRVRVRTGARGSAEPARPAGPGADPGSAPA